MAYAIRPYRDDDAESLSGILRSAIAVIGPRAYDEAQVAAWSARAPSPDRYRERVANGAIIVIAADGDDVPVAYALLERDADAEPDQGGHLDHLYCHPDHTRQGLAVQLLLEAEQRAAALQVHRLYTEASELARPAFERAGYRATHRRNFEIESPDGPVAIHNYAMEKLLV